MTRRKGGSPHVASGGGEAAGGGRDVASEYALEHAATRCPRERTRGERDGRGQRASDEALPATPSRALAGWTAGLARRTCLRRRTPPSNTRQRRRRRARLPSSPQRKAPKLLRNRATCSQSESCSLQRCPADSCEGDPPNKRPSRRGNEGGQLTSLSRASLQRRIVPRAVQEERSTNTRPGEEGAGRNPRPVSLLSSPKPSSFHPSSGLFGLSRAVPFLLYPQRAHRRSVML